MTNPGITIGTSCINLGFSKLVVHSDGLRSGSELTLTDLASPRVANVVRNKRNDSIGKDTWLAQERKREREG
jgi:hypothetical protein